MKAITGRGKDNMRTVTRQSQEYDGGLYSFDVVNPLILPLDKGLFALNLPLGYLTFVNYCSFNFKIKYYAHRLKFSMK